ncbi:MULTISPECIES: GNAT family N-acetyltransferase [Gulbenkiania]|uniref:Acetyltransferase (GNAT) family n=2 Tax=Gulbenkiania TaxID=397456 RepID=A0A0K6GUT4_9NEIS|nr:MULTISPECIES: GNAT family N-acetyltransferase [Gulbenkiania]TCW33935.1 acetyltransferase (GNAT) family protein [Gulbenkiania mobilis]CUA82304.1 Acetyltransferase (GNAT) family [Gulbenkiania indica]
MSQSPLHLAFGADPAARALISDGLTLYNTGHVGPYAYEAFELYARDDSGRVMGGLFGQAGMGWLYVDYLWLHPEARHDGLGSRLMAEVEAKARQLGCVGMFLYTYDFQAPDFYRKLGFDYMGELEDCPPGHRRIYLKKRLTPESA